MSLLRLIIVMRLHLLLHTFGLYPFTYTPLRSLMYTLYSNGGLDVPLQLDGHSGSFHNNRILVVVLLLTLGCGRLSTFEKSGDRHMRANFVYEVNDIKL